MNKYFVLIIFLVLQGCTSYTLKDYANNSISTADYNSLLRAESLPPSECDKEWRKSYTKKRTYPLPNGNFVYVNHGKCGCIIHWEIDKKTHKIVGYKFEGDRCY